MHDNTFYSIQRNTVFHQTFCNQSIYVGNCPVGFLIPEMRLLIGDDIIGSFTHKIDVLLCSSDIATFVKALRIKKQNITISENPVVVAVIKIRYLNIGAVFSRTIEILIGRQIFHPVSICAHLTVQLSKFCTILAPQRHKLSRISIFKFIVGHFIGGQVPPGTTRSVKHSDFLPPP
ncbi:hypothetical protein D3C81_1451690 [compost metagenome]